ncbi:MAG: hypothetical protein ACYCTB_06545 [bacterium]
MVTKEDYYSIKAYYEIGLSLKSIAGKFNLHPTFLYARACLQNLF